VLGRNPHEGEASGGRRRRYGRGNGGEGGNAREGGAEWGRCRGGWTSGRGRALSESVGGTAERERKERGVQPQKCHAAWDGRDPDATRRGGVSLFGQWHAGADQAGPSGRESGGARVARGPAREESAGPSLDEQ
jgi:hypothetical protein